MKGSKAAGVVKFSVNSLMSSIMIMINHFTDFLDNDGGTLWVRSNQH